MSDINNVLKGINNVLITGAGGGIGKAFAIEFAKLGLNCVLVDINIESLKEISNSIEREYGVKTWVLEQDLSVHNAAQNVFDYCKAQNIQIDILVNNAGIMAFKEFVTFTEEQINTMLYLHIHCTTFLTYLFGKEMLERKRGFIINVSSITAWMKFPGIHLYNATKSYIYSFSRSIYYEFIRNNVGVTVVCPSGVNTACFKLPEKYRNWALKLGLLVKPEKVAEISIKKALKFKKEVFPNYLDRFFIFISTHIIDPVIFWIMKKLPQFQDPR